MYILTDEKHVKPEITLKSVIRRDFSDYSNNRKIKIHSQTEFAWERIPFCFCFSAQPRKTKQGRRERRSQGRRRRNESFKFSFAFSFHSRARLVAALDRRSTSPRKKKKREKEVGAIGLSEHFRHRQRWVGNPVEAEEEEERGGGGRRDPRVPLVLDWSVVGVSDGGIDGTPKVRRVVR